MNENKSLTKENADMKTKIDVMQGENETLWTEK